MQYARLGRSGLKISRVVFGGAHLGEIIHDDDVTKLVHAAWDHGITTFYTADDYNQGAGEELLGRAIAPRREDCVIIIKAGYRVGTENAPASPAERMATHGLGRLDHTQMWHNGVAPTSRGLNRRHLTRALDESLRRLGTDYVDVYSAHFWDPETPIEETLETFDGFIKQGKVRYLSCSQTKSWQLYKALWASERHDFARYEGLQIRFNMFERQALLDEIPAAADAGISLLAFNSLAGELLTGNYTRDGPKQHGMGYRRHYQEMYWNDATFGLLDRLKACSAEMGRSVGELAQAWTLAQEAVTSLLIGPNRPAEFGPQVAAADRPLTSEELAAVEAILTKVPLDLRQGTVGPYGH